MNELSTESTIPSITKEANDALCGMACRMIEEFPDLDLPLKQWITDGIYYRTLFLPAGFVIISAMVKIPTTILITGDCLATIGDHVERFTGICNVKASANRRVAYRALEDTFITMYFKTSATDVTEAEKEMTDEFNLLTNHREELMLGNE